MYNVEVLNANGKNAKQKKMYNVEVLNANSKNAKQKKNFIV